ncbi:hypothetical protein FQZ97_851790 [compost metagenome]
MGEEDGEDVAGRIHHGDAAGAELAGHGGVEDEVPVVELEVRPEDLAHFGQVDDQPVGAPDVGHAVLVARVLLGELVHQLGVEVGAVGDLRPVDLLVDPGLDLLGHEGGGRVDHVIPRVAAEQLGLEAVVAVQHVVLHLDPVGLLEALQGIRRHVAGPVDDVQFIGGQRHAGTGREQGAGEQQVQTAIFHCSCPRAFR